MSAITNVKKACERRILTLGYPCAFEGVSFEPVTDQLYLRVNFRVNPPDDPVIGDAYYRERITLQVFVVDKNNTGTGNILSVAETVRALFNKGLTLNESGTRIYILNTAQISGVASTGDRLIVPVLIDVIAEVFN